LVDDDLHELLYGNQNVEAAGAAAPEVLEPPNAWPET
jgi:hypothetical protein